MSTNNRNDHTSDLRTHKLSLPVWRLSLYCSFDKAALHRICTMTATGIARAIQPAFTSVDGDLVVALSTGELRTHGKQVAETLETHMNELVGHICETAMKWRTLYIQRKQRLKVGPS